MDRNILTVGEKFNSSDMCQTNKNAYVGLAKAACAILGTTTLLNGFTCTQTPTPGMQVIVGPGEIYQMAATDTTAYGSLPTDFHQILKQGVNLDALPANTFTFTAPATAGQSVNYLLEFQLKEDDIDDENRTFFGGAPQVVPTIRQDSVYVKQLVGTPAATGSQVTPTPEAGFVGGFVITIANGQTTITNSNISVYPGAPFITETLTQKISQATGDARYAQLSQFANSLASTSGYQKFPNGLILQWGSSNGNFAAGTYQDLLLPISYPNSGFKVYVTWFGVTNPSAGDTSIFGGGFLSNSQIRVFNVGSGNGSCQYLTIGN
jgi:hypothetical protein